MGSNTCLALPPDPTPVLHCLEFGATHQEGLTPEDRLEGLTPEDRLEGLSAKDRKRLLQFLQSELRK